MNTGDQLFDLPESALPEESHDKVFGFLKDDTLAVAQNDKIQFWDCRAKALRKELSIPQPLDAWNSVSPFLSFDPNGDRCRLLQREEAVDIRLPDGKETRRHLNIGPLAVENARAADARFWDASFTAERVAVGEGVTIHVSDLRQGQGSKPFADLDRGLVLDSSSKALDSLSIALVGERFLFLASIFPFDIQTAQTAPEIPRIARLTDDRMSLRYVDDGWIAVQPLPGKEVAETVPRTLLEGASDLPQDAPSLGFTRDGRSVFRIPYYCHELRLWDAATGKKRPVIDFQPVGGYDKIRLSSDGAVVIGRASAGSIEVWREGDHQPAQAIKNIQPQSTIALAPNGMRAAAYDPWTGSVTIWDTSNGRRVGVLSTELKGNFDCFDPEFSSSGRYLLVTRQIWDLETTPPQLVWKAEPDHAVGPTGYAPIHRWGALFSDERHVVVAQDAQFQVWDWRENQKLATLFLVVDGWAWVNHVTHHWSGSPKAAQYLRTDFTHESGRKAEVSISGYEQATGWKNDPKKAGLDLGKRNREKGVGDSADG